MLALGRPSGRNWLDGRSKSRSKRDSFGEAVEVLGVGGGVRHGVAAADDERHIGHVSERGGAVACQRSGALKVHVRVGGAPVDDVAAGVEGDVEIWRSAGEAEEFEG